jgi:hypothetical protein
VWPVRIAGLLGLGCCRAKPIIAYKGEENRLPGSTGRAEVTVLLWISAHSLASALSTAYGAIAKAAAELPHSTNAREEIF